MNYRVFSVSALPSPRDTRRTRMIPPDGHSPSLSSSLCSRCRTRSRSHPWLRLRLFAAGVNGGDGGGVGGGGGGCGEDAERSLVQKEGESGGARHGRRLLAVKGSAVPDHGLQGENDATTVMRRSGRGVSGAGGIRGCGRLMMDEECPSSYGEGKQVMVGVGVANGALRSERQGEGRQRDWRI